MADQLQAVATRNHSPRGGFAFRARERKTINPEVSPGSIFWRGPGWGR